MCVEKGCTWRERLWKVCVCVEPRVVWRDRQRCVCRCVHMEKLICVCVLRDWVVCMFWAMGMWVWLEGSE